MKQNFRTIALALCLTMAAPMLGACKDTGTTPTTTKPAVSAAPATPVAEKMTLPLKEKLTVRYWMPFDPKFAAAYNSLKEVEIFNYIEEKLNIEFDFIEPSGDAKALKEQFGLMIASNDLPDVISNFDKYYSGTGVGSGAVQGFEDGLTIDISKYITEENMPNLHKLFAEFPELKKQSSYNEHHVTVPYFRNTEGLYTTGWVLRQDILDANGWAQPQTAKELDELLYKMKDKGVKIPLTMGSLNSTIGIPSLAPAWGMRSAYEYQVFDTHEVRFGAVQPEYKEMLDLLRKWYADGILDPDFLTNDSKTSNAKVAEGSAGVWFGSRTGDSLSPWNAALDANPDSKMVLYGIPDLKKDKNHVVTEQEAFGTAVVYRPDYSPVITTKCKDPSNLLLALDWLGYSNDGISLLHFGIEGEHFVREADGRINRFVDVNGSAVPMVDANANASKWKKLASGDMTVWAGNSNGPFINGIIDFKNHQIIHPSNELVQVPRWFAPDDKSLEAIKAKREQDSFREWSKNWAFSDHSYNIPTDVVYTKEQSAVRAEYYASIKTFIEEYSASYILGKVGTDTFDAFVNDLNTKMNLPKVVEAFQGAVDTYYGKK